MTPSAFRISKYVGGNGNAVEPEIRYLAW